VAAESRHCFYRTKLLSENYIKKKIGLHYWVME